MWYNIFRVFYRHKQVNNVNLHNYCKILETKIKHFFLILSVIVMSFLQAASFRYSNYFICLFIQSICILNQIKLHDKAVESKSSKSKEVNLEEFKVVQVRRIELPRSLAQIVINWNIPMHYWLKKCNLFKI